MRARPQLRRSTAAVAMLAALLAGCGSSRSGLSASGSSGKIEVVAAENFWGSIAAQLGGDKVHVTSVIDKPDTDPHDYEPTPADGRRVASAGYVIVNGVGYDPWADHLLAANPKSGRTTLDVGDLVGVKDGGNPHRWYSPLDVFKVIDRITADYKQLDAADGAYFEQQHGALTTTGLGPYNSLIAAIKARWAGTPVGASESIFALMASALGLDLVTPPSFLTAISEGTDATAADKATIDAQIKGHQIKVYVFNRQNSTPDVQAQVDEARAAGIPTTAITETLTPATASFEQWQSAQLEALQSALGQAVPK